MIATSPFTSVRSNTHTTDFDTICSTLRVTDNIYTEPNFVQSRRLFEIQVAFNGPTSIALAVP